MERDFVKEAENVILSLKNGDRRGNLNLTTSQIRQILALGNIINNQILQYELKNEDSDELPERITNLIKGMEVKLVYQAGRDNQVKTFVTKSKLREEIKGIGNSKKKFKDFFSYLEALVAYHRFHGGKE